MWLGGGQQHTAEQGLRAEPTGVSKQRGKRRQHGANLGGWSKHKRVSLGGDPSVYSPRRHPGKWIKPNVKVEGDKIRSEHVYHDRQTMAE